MWYTACWMTFIHSYIKRQTIIKTCNTLEEDQEVGKFCSNLTHVVYFSGNKYESVYIMFFFIIWKL